MAFFVVRTRYRPEQEEKRLRARAAHREWLATLRNTGALVNAGPLADGSGAILIFSAAGRTELDGLLQADPYPRECIELAWVGEWQPLFEAR